MKKYIIVFLCSVCFIIPVNSYAKKVTCSNANYSAIVEIDKEKLSIGEEAFISVKSDTENFEITYAIEDKSFAKVDSNGIVKALKEGSTKINTSIKFSETNSCNVTLSLDILSSDSSLKSLTLEELDISAIFQKDKYEYEIVLPYNFEKVNIIAEANNENAKIIGDGRRYLNEGNNEYEVIVTATDGTTSTYKIIIIREDANDDVTLENLIIEGYVLTPKFDKNTYKYSLNVDKEVEDITITATPTYEFAKIKGIGTFALATGENTYYITVTAENGNEQTYEVVITKNNGSSKLKSLEVKGYKLDSKFDSDKYIYNLTVTSNVKKLDIKAKCSDDEQIEIIGNDKLKYGKNDIIIRVTGKDKSSTTYKIVVNRLSVEEEKELEKNNKLLNILLVMFIIAIIFMISSIVVFLKKNYKRKTKNIKGNKKRNKRRIKRNNR